MSRFEVSETFDMCGPDHGKKDHVVADSPVSGYFGYSHKLTTSPYSVALKHGIPIEYDKQKNQDGHDKCYQLCQREWSLKETKEFEQLVRQGYGYRLFLDDLPSATKYDDKDHYDENIPLGYIAEPTSKSSSLTE